MGIARPYEADEVLRLRGSVTVEHSLARRGAEKLWQLMHRDEPVRALGAVTGNQAMQMVRAGLEAIYLSGWQVAADANTAGAMYPDQSLYPANAGPELARRINKTLQRADQIEVSEGQAQRDWFVPIVADAEAGFGGPLNCFEIMKAYIEAGVAAVHFEDQLASEKKCGHLGGKVLIPTQAHIRNLTAARLAADVCGVPTLIVARTDAESAKLITSDIDERDRPFLNGSAPPRASSASRTAPASNIALRAASPSRRTPTSCGGKQATPTSTTPARSPRRCTPNIRASCWPIIAARASTGRPSWTRLPSPSSSASWARWATSSSSSPWRASTASITACSALPAPKGTAP